MPEVTCPSCHTRQAVDATATGYVCVSCGAEWDFVECATCHSRFHSAPDATSWRCPTCGTENTRPHAGPVASLGAGPNRTMLLAGAAFLVLVLIAWAYSRGGDEAAAPTPTGTTSPSAAVTGTAREQLCSHLIDFQTLRFDAIGRTAQELRADAAALAAEGDATLARDVRKLARASAALRDAFDTPEDGDDQVATDALLAALEPMPC